MNRSSRPESNSRLRLRYAISSKYRTGTKFLARSIDGVRRSSKVQNRGARKRFLQRSRFATEYRYHELRLGCVSWFHGHAWTDVQSSPFSTLASSLGRALKLSLELFSLFIPILNHTTANKIQNQYGDRDKDKSVRAIERRDDCGGRYGRCGRDQAVAAARRHDQSVPHLQGGSNGTVSRSGSKGD